MDGKDERGSVLVHQLLHLHLVVDWRKAQEGMGFQNGGAVDEHGSEEQNEEQVGMENQDWSHRNSQKVEGVSSEECGDDGEDEEGWHQVLDCLVYQAQRKGVHKDGEGKEEKGEDGDGGEDDGEEWKRQVLEKER